MNSLFGFGLALAATSSLLAAHGGPELTGEPTSLQGGGGRVTFQPGKGITFDGGDAFHLNWVNRIQAGARYINRENARDTMGFNLRRVRSEFRGHAFRRDVRYLLILDLADVDGRNSVGNSLVKDASLTWDFIQGDAPVSIRLGQGKFRSGLQADGLGVSQSMVQRSVATRTFANGRSVGALFEGSALEDGMLRWHAGIYNSDVAAASSAAVEGSSNAGQNEVNFTFGVQFDPHGSTGDRELWSEGDLGHTGDLKSTFGATLQLINEGDQFNTDAEAWSLNLFGALKTGSGIAGQGEVWLRNDELTAAGGADADSLGWYLQGSVTTDPQAGETQYGGAVRVSMVDFDDNPIAFAGGAVGLDVGRSRVLVGTAGDVFELSGTFSAYYYEHKMKSQVGYTFQSLSPSGGGDADNHAIELLTTLSF